MFQRTGKIRLAPGAPPSPLTIEVAPLIDIVFLLICFYLLVAQLISDQKDPSVELPSMANPAARQEAPAEFVINLRRDGAVTVGGRAVSLATLRALLADELAAAGEGERPLRVVIRADRRQRYGELDELFKVCRQSGVRQIIFRTRKKDRQ